MIQIILLNLLLVLLEAPTNADFTHLFTELSGGSEIRISNSRRNLQDKLGDACHDPHGRPLTCASGCRKIDLGDFMCKCWCPDSNEVIRDAPDVGEYGGVCTCPNDKIYHVGAINNDRNKLACVNGVASGFFQSKGEWSHKMVVCEPQPWKINPKNTNDCKRILTRKECEYAAKNMYQNEFNKVGHQMKYGDNLPRGCYIYFGTYLVYNHHPVGAPSLNARQLCKDHQSCHVEMWVGELDTAIQSSVNSMAMAGTNYHAESYASSQFLYDHFRSARVIGENCYVTFKDPSGRARCRLGEGDYSLAEFANCAAYEITQYEVENSKCQFLPGTRWKNLDFGGHKRTKELNKESCRGRCEKTKGCVGSSYWPNDGGCHLTNTYELEKDEESYYYTVSYDCQNYGCHVETWGGGLDDTRYQASINTRGENGKTYHINSYLNGLGRVSGVSSGRIVGDGCQISFMDFAGKKRCELGPGQYDRNSFVPACGNDVITQYSVEYNPCGRDNGGCSGKATCHNNQGTSECTCITGYEGNGFVCTEIDACKTANGGCSKDATCTSIQGIANCDCNDGFEGNGKICTKIDPCKMGNEGCSIDATCTNNKGSAKCDCNEGFEGNGIICTQINPCETDNGGCSDDATCRNMEGVAACYCKTDYEGDGFTCTRINPCKTDNGGCSDNAICKNKQGIAVCDCEQGFEGDGFTCTKINPCKIDNGGCSAHAKCTPNKSGWADCDCNEGFEGNGRTCFKIDPCRSRNGGCSLHATCHNKEGEAKCVCKIGYDGDGVTCTWRNPCNNYCAENASCSYRTGRLVCECYQGYEGDGINSCTRINPCDTDNGGCDPENAICKGDEIIPELRCECKEGFEGDGKTCTKIFETVNALPNRRRLAIIEEKYSSGKIGIMYFFICVYGICSLYLWCKYVNFHFKAKSKNELDNFATDEVKFREKKIYFNALATDEVKFRDKKIYTV